MRKPILAGNWKMNKTPAEAVEFVRALRPKLTPLSAAGGDGGVPAVRGLPAVADALRGVKIGVGAQNCIGPRTAPTPARCRPRCWLGWPATSSSATRSGGSTSARPTRASTRRSRPRWRMV